MTEQKIRRTLTAAAVLFVLSFIAVVTSFVVAANTQDSNRQRDKREAIERASALKFEADNRAYEICIKGNVDRARDLEVWDSVFALVKAPSDEVKGLHDFIRLKDAPQPCGNKPTTTTTRP